MEADDFSKDPRQDTEDEDTDVDDSAAVPRRHGPQLPALGMNGPLLIHKPRFSYEPPVAATSAAAASGGAPVDAGAAVNEPRDTDAHAPCGFSSAAPAEAMPSREASCPAAPAEQSAAATARFIVHQDSVTALPGELRRRAKAGSGVDVRG